MSGKLQSIRQILSFLVKGPGFDNVLHKLNVTSVSEGRCVCELIIGEEHQNRGGSLHGGLTATLVDVVSTVALMANDNTGPGVSVNMNISYLRPARVGDEIVIDASTIKLGKSLAYLTVDIKNKKDGKVIANGTHTKHLGSKMNATSKH